MHDNKSGEKKKPILYKETRNGKMHKIYIHVCSHMGIQKMSHKSKAKCTGFQCKAFCACMWCGASHDK